MRVRHVGGIKAAEVQLGQAAAPEEHVGHVRYLGGIKAISKVDFPQVLEIREQIGGGTGRDPSVSGYVQIAVDHPREHASVSGLGYVPRGAGGILKGAEEGQGSHIFALMLSLSPETCGGRVA